MFRRQFLITAVATIALLAASQLTSAQGWPTKPIRAIQPFGAGSALDVVARPVLEQLSRQLGQPIVVEHRAGAGGTIGTAVVAKSEPDGNTILATTSALTVAPTIYKTMPYDTVRELSSVATLGIIPNVLVTSPAKGLKTIQAFVTAAKAKPASFNYVSAGVGSATHLSAELFRIRAGIEAVHVPMKSGPEAMTEILSGRADFYLCPANTALPFIREGKLLGLVVSGSGRVPELPEVPTTSEANFLDADYTFWIGLFAPSRTPRDVIDRLHDETVKALETPAIREKLAGISVSPLKMTPVQFDARIKDEITANAIIVKTAGIQAE